MFYACSRWRTVRQKEMNAAINLYNHHQPNPDVVISGRGGRWWLWWRCWSWLQPWTGMSPITPLYHAQLPSQTTSCPNVSNNRVGSSRRLYNVAVYDIAMADLLGIVKVEKKLKIKSYVRKSRKKCYLLVLIFC